MIFSHHSVRLCYHTSHNQTWYLRPLKYTLVVASLVSELWLEYHFADMLWILNDCDLERLFMVCDVEKSLLRNLKILRLFFVQFLIIGFFGNSLLPQACYCGDVCIHGLQDKTRVNLPFHNRCSGNDCKTCNLEDIQSIKASNASHSTEKLQKPNTPFILSNFSDYQFNINFINIFSYRLNKYLKVQSPPTYLQNLSLLLWSLFKQILHIIKPEQSLFWNHLYSTE